MTHPLLKLLVTQPHLLGHHADAYAELMGAELATASSELKHQAWLSALAICGWVVCAVLAGISLMLLAVIPYQSMPAAWALIVVPLLPATVALWYQNRLKRTRRTPPFGSVRQQIQADLAMLREANAQ